MLETGKPWATPAHELLPIFHGQKNRPVLLRWKEINGTHPSTVLPQRIQDQNQAVLVHLKLLNFSKNIDLCIICNKKTDINKMLSSDLLRKINGEERTVSIKIPFYPGILLKAHC